MRANINRLLLSIPLFVVGSRDAHAQWQTVTTFELSADVYVPATQSPVGSGRALLVGLHGCLQSAEDLRTRAELEASAEALGAVVALPDVPFGGVIAGCWDYYGTNHTPTNRHNGALLSLTESLVDDVALGIDPDQVYIAGLSSGGGQAVVAGCLAPDVFAGVGVIAGPALGTEASQVAAVGTTMESAAMSCASLAGGLETGLDDQLAVTYTSSGDFVVAQGYALLNAEMYGELYGAVEAEPFDLQPLAGYEPAGDGVFFDDAGGHRVAWLVAQGQGHAWPAGSGPGPELSYVATEGVDFGRFLLEFFRDNNRRVEPAPGGDTGDDDAGDAGDAGDTGDDGASTGVGSDGETGADSEPDDSTEGSEDTSSLGPAQGESTDSETGSTATEDDEVSGCRFGSGPSPLMLLPILYFALARGSNRTSEESFPDHKVGEERRFRMSVKTRSRSSDYAVDRVLSVVEHQVESVAP